MSDPGSEGESDSESDSPEAQPIYPNRGPNPEQMASEYLPEAADWEAKTILDITDPAAVASLREFERMFPEVQDLQPLVDEFLMHFLKTRTSVHGQSREEYRNILVSMFGGKLDEDTARSVMVDAFIKGEQEDD